MKETLKKLKTGIVEITSEVVSTEVLTVNPAVLDRDIIAAEEAVTRRKSELATAEKNLKHFKDLKVKISKAK